MLSQTVGYAIRALTYLARMKDRSVLVREISDATNIPYAFLAKIVNTLGRKQFVVTQRGIRGGISLARIDDVHPPSCACFRPSACRDDRGGHYAPVPHWPDRCPWPACAGRDEHW